MSSLAQRLRLVRTEVQANPRLRWGGLAIMGILAVYLLLVLSDWRRDLHQEYQQRTAELYKMALLAGQDQWLARAQEARSMRRALEAEIPVSSSIGLAQAEVQNSIGQIILAFGRTLNTTTQAPVQVAGREGVWRIPITVNGVVQPRLLLEILRRIEAAPSLTTIEQFSLVMQQGRPVLSMVVVTYYRVETSRGTGNATP